MLREVRKRERDPGVFVRMSTIRPEAEKRGTAEDSVALFGLWADIDIEGPGHKHDPSRYEGRRLPPDQAAAEAIVAHLPEPTAWIASGGGYYPMWLPVRPWVLGRDLTAEQWVELSEDLQASVYEAAKQNGWHFGVGTGDIARILRIPGTVNRKIEGDPRPCYVEWGGGPNYTYEELRAAIPQREKAPARPSAAPPASRQAPIPVPVPSARLVAPVNGYESDGLSPAEWFNQNNDLCALLEADGWTFAGERQGRRDYARPGKHPRDGISGNVMDDGGRQVLYVFSESAGLPTQQGLSPFDWYAERHHGGNAQEAARQIRGLMPKKAPTMAPGATGSAQMAGPGLPATVRSVEEGFWARRPVLAAIRQSARVRRVGPFAVLGAVLAQVACRIGPHVVLPPTVGGVGSLNLFVGLVGPSGAGKDAAIDTADEILGRGAPNARVEAASGQGIDAAFTHPHPKEGPIQFCDSVLFEVSEIDSLAAAAGMNGSTTMPTLRKVFTGKALGAHYAAKDKRRPVGQHKYRAALVAGIQPARAGVLLDDADGGTPQRWVWLPTNDPTRYRGRFAMPEQVIEIGWTDYDTYSAVGVQPDDEPVKHKDRVVVEICPTAEQAILAVQEAKLGADLIGQAGDLQGHALFTRLKVAALLGFLGQRRGPAEVTEEDWEIAGLLMTVSEHTRGLCQQVLAEKARQTSVARGRSRARQAEAEADEAANIADERQQRIEELTGKAVEKLKAAGGTEMSPRELLKGCMDGATRARLGDEVLAQVVEVAGVQQGPEVSAGGRKIRKLRWIG
ncbi:hypothetical protein O7622_11295 [Micromonospora sp. WMMD1076]|uniref:hypothetical protein n=1 Tax=Micromonospora sp. WMMD1076 TaxID=3016103 RepID=UPI00249C56DE|nr:hypothetical protein [Micromonospora sp. WMMD1076]WFF09095.1 hypothetical protein O7622_11295 [Micromonospora sp. WMMD1076]